MAFRSRWMVRRATPVSWTSSSMEMPWRASIRRITSCRRPAWEYFLAGRPLLIAARCAALLAGRFAGLAGFLGARAPAALLLGRLGSPLGRGGGAGSGGRCGCCCGYLLSGGLGRPGGFVALGGLVGAPASV